MNLIQRIRYLVVTRGEELTKLYLRRRFRDPAHRDEYAAFIFPHYVTTEIPPFHRALYNAFHSSIELKQHMARAAPRGSAKSTAAAVIELSHVAAYTRRRFVIYLSDTATQAEGLLIPLQNELDTNERFIWLYGRLKSQSWNKADFVTTTGVRFLAKGQGMKIRGLRFNENRPDLLVFDDLENDDEIRNPVQRAKLKKWFLAAALGALDPDTGVAWVLGTVLHEDSLLQNILEHKTPFEDWDAETYRAVILKEGQEFWEGESFWPGRFSMEWLKQKSRELGFLVFRQEYQNEAIAEGTRLCPPSFIRPPDYTVALDDTQRTAFLAADPAISKKVKADKSGIVGGHVWRAANGDVLRIRVSIAHASKMTMLETAKKLQDYDQALKPQAVGIEKVAYQQGLIEVTQKLGLPAKAMDADGDKVRRFNRISPYMEQGLVEIDPALTELITQLLNFTGEDGNEDDLVDAFVYFVSLCVEKAEQQFQIFVG